MHARNFLFRAVSEVAFPTHLSYRRLEENYEIAEGVCIPRSALYMHYLDFSEKHDTQPVNAASFGKVSSRIQFTFPSFSAEFSVTHKKSSPSYECSLNV